MCFIQEYWTGLKLKCVAPKLSQSGLGCPINGRLNSLNKERSHEVSDTALARALYSAFVDERATTLCFLKLQEIGLTPRKLYMLMWRSDLRSCLPNPHQSM